MNDSIMVYIILTLACLFIFIVSIRAIFNIPTIVKNLSAQTKLLNEIAKTQGVNQGLIDVINNEFVNKNH